jgi:hypothetical protein
VGIYLFLPSSLKGSSVKRHTNYLKPNDVLVLLFQLVLENPIFLINIITSIVGFEILSIKD